MDTSVTPVAATATHDASPFVEMVTIELGMGHQPPPFADAVQLLEPRPQLRRYVAFHQFLN